MTASMTAIGRSTCERECASGRLDGGESDAPTITFASVRSQIPAARCTRAPSGSSCSDGDDVAPEIAHRYARGCGWASEAQTKICHWQAISSALPSHFNSIFEPHSSLTYSPSRRHKTSTILSSLLWSAIFGLLLQDLKFLAQPNLILNLRVVRRRSFLRGRSGRRSLGRLGGLLQPADTFAATITATRSPAGVRHPATRRDSSAITLLSTLIGSVQ